MVKTAEMLVDDELAKLEEEGPLPREDVKTWWRWIVHIVNILEAMGLHYRGESIKNQGWATLLVLKVARDGVPLVVFCTERDTTACMRRVLRELDAGTIQFREDKYA